METIRAQWMPVFIEPIPFSGERICAVVVVRADDGETKVVETMPLHAVQCLFGNEAMAMATMSRQAAESLYEHSKAGHDLEAWISPMDGIYSGPVRTVQETNLKAAVDTVIANVSSLSQSDQSQKAPERASLVWMREVKGAALKLKPNISELFNVKLCDQKGTKITIGFAGTRLAAEFAAINLRSSWSAHSATIYRKLINLTMARSHVPMYKPDHFEMLLRTPEPKLVNGDANQRVETLQWEAERAAESLHVTLRMYSSPVVAAKRLIEML